MTTTIQKWGNSQGIRIPKIILDTVHWNDNEELTLIVKGNEVVIKKANERKGIKELFEGFDGEYIPEEIDWGEPVGKEIW
ncbi:MAG: AbrB/MazE/SpoVT family DNA-binding domain-containing protein [Huintestinicola sp.]|uniref:AbrB/MazE/SpoVT family DNA-binding domain-containing protein n=1 Tax=Huintestinicola sp. TaxID=2981661 RepID=UPI003F0AD656